MPHVCHGTGRYNITGAQNVNLLSSQTENPYWIQNDQSTPACMAKGAHVQDSTHVNLYGIVWCSWSVVHTIT